MTKTKLYKLFFINNSDDKKFLLQITSVNKKTRRTNILIRSSNESVTLDLTSEVDVLFTADPSRPWE